MEDWKFGDILVRVSDEDRKIFPVLAYVAPRPEGGYAVGTPFWGVILKARDGRDFEVGHTHRGRRENWRRATVEDLS